MKTLLLSSALFSLCAVTALPSFGDASQPVPPDQHTQTRLSQNQYTIVPTAKMFAKAMQEQTDYRSFTEDGKANLRAHNFVVAEEDFREAISADPSEVAYLGLGEALVGQGRTADALQAYRLIFHPSVGQFQGGSYAPKEDLEYALLLNQNGQWAEAVTRYNDALPRLTEIGLKNPTKLDPDTPQPLALTVIAHIGLGLYDNVEYEPDSDTKAFQEYTTALQLAPNWDAANYYYGVGWSHLELKSQARASHAAQAKAALKKAAASEDAVVGKAAAEALKNAQ